MSEVNYDADGFDEFGFDAEGYGRDGYDADGYDREGYDADGYNTEGYDEYGEPEEPDYDDSMDGDFDSGMASAGFGTDEDYGG